MSQKKNTQKPLAVAVGAALVTSLATTMPASAVENPFAMSELSSGYMVAEMAEGKCGAGMKMDKEGQCGAARTTGNTNVVKEGKCGIQTMDANGDGNITREEFMQGHGAMFGKLDTNADGVIDADEQSAGMKMMMEGQCGAARATDKSKTMKEGKCGEGKCGASNK